MIRQQSLSLSSLHPSDVQGVYAYVDKERNRYRIQFYRDGTKRTLTLKSTHPRAAQREFDRYAKDWNRLGWALFDRKEERRLTVREAKEAFIRDNRARRLAVKTITTRENILDLLVDSLSRHTALRDLTAEEVQAVYLAPSLKSAASQASYFTVLRTFLRWCVKEGLLEVSPLEGVKKPGVPKKVPDYFTPEQFRALLKHIDADLEQNKHKYTGRASLVLELPDLVRFAVLTGLRRTEQLSIRWMDVDLQHGLVHVRSYVDKGRRITFNVKDGDGRIVPLAPEAREILERRREGRTNGDDTEPVFCGLKGRRRDGARLSRTFKSYVRDAKGVPDHLYWHALRHTFASWLVSGGTPVAIVSDWLGHADISLTMTYYAALMPSALQWTGSSFHAEALD